MPKELTHWHIAREAMKKGIPGEVGKIIASNPALYYLGAIAHDIGFYDLSSPSLANLEHVANQLHGVGGENTVAPLCEIMKRALGQNNHRVHLAFLLGMLTHFVADSTFHPMVYYMSGNYFAEDPEERDKAVYRHRLLETAIDLWLKSVQPMDYPSGLLQLWRDTGETERKAFRLLIEQAVCNGDIRKIEHFHKAWRNYRLLQTVFGWSTPRKMLSIYRSFGHLSVGKLEALFYTQPLDLSFFETKLAWRHPVTGERHAIMIEAFFDLCVKKVVRLFNQLTEQPLEKWAHFLCELSPLSLDTGLPLVPVARMEFFDAEPLEYRLRSRPLFKS